MAYTQKEIAAVEKQLNSRLEELGARVEDIEQTIREPINPDFAERANDYDEADALKGLETAALHEVVQIRAALTRIAEDSYGECQTCSADISAKRLAAVPFATQCIDCAGN